MDKKISNIVFTKNRPLQLHAYLESFYKHFSADLIQTYLLYKPELFGEQYQQLFQKFPNCKVIEETDFHSDFLSILNEINTEYTLFGVDDVVYFDSVDFALIDKIFQQKDDIFGFSLRFGQNILSGPDEVEELKISDQSFYRVDWTNGQTPNARYPFELCATIYKTGLIKKIFKSTMNQNKLLQELFGPVSPLAKALGKKQRHKLLKFFGYFFSPNTLESWNCRWCQNHAEKLASKLYFQKLCASAIQVNMVNTSTNNDSDSCAEYTVEALAEKYRQGYRLNIDAVVGDKPIDTHCSKEAFKLTKNTK